MAIFLGLLSSCLVVSFAIHRHVALTYGSEEGGSFALRAAAAPRGGKDTTAKTSIELPRGRRLLGTDKTSSQSQSSNQNKRDEDGESIIELVHVVHTRFMQSQPHLLALGRARLEMFRTFCLPSMVNQSSQNFLWLIYTDPNLDSALKEELLALVSPYENFVVVASNNFPQNFRKSAPLELMDPSKIWSGDASLIGLGYEAAKIWPVLESRLDMDDGLHNYFVELVQMDAALSTNCGSPDDLSDQAKWKYWCSYTSIEWQPHNPFPLSKIQVNQEEISHGYVVGVATPYCQTPGLTVLLCPATEFSSVPSAPHHKLLQTVSECPEDDRSSNCVRRLKKLSPASIRARSITSHGMLNVMVREGDTMELYTLVDNQRQKQEVLWDGIEEFMHITRNDSEKTKVYLEQNLAEIASDNLRGQCTRGHSCKESTRELLEKIANGQQPQNVSNIWN